MKLDEVFVYRRAMMTPKYPYDKNVEPFHNAVYHVDSQLPIPGKGEFDYSLTVEELIEKLRKMGSGYDFVSGLPSWIQEEVEMPEIYERNEQLPWEDFKKVIEAGIRIRRLEDLAKY